MRECKGFREVDAEEVDVAMKVDNLSIKRVCCINCNRLFSVVLSYVILTVGSLSDEKI